MSFDLRTEFSIRNARVVTADQVFTGGVRVYQGEFNDVTSDHHGLSGEDWAGDYLLPGLVELHTDNIEKHLLPRPKVCWPVPSAVMAHDAQVVSAGITTVLDAIAVGDLEPGSLRTQTLHACVKGFDDAREAGLLRADHYLHLRLELGEENLLSLFNPLARHQRLKLVSLMDHTPGQRQWADIGAYRAHVAARHCWSEQHIDHMLAVFNDRQQRYVNQNREKVISLCRDQLRHLPLATHDDTLPEHVSEGVRDGMRISEFPTTLRAAQAAHDHGLAVVMGAPNAVRGKSHSGNVSAAELARHGLVDILSSDYVPSSLLHGAFLLQESGYSLPRSIATVSRHPAQQIGLTDRGEVAVGLRADFLRVRIFQGIPVVLGVWKQGRQIA